MWLIICLYNRRRTRTTVRWVSVLAARREPSATLSLNHPFFKLKIGSSDSDTSTCSIGLLSWYAVCVCMCVCIYIYPSFRGIPPPHVHDQPKHNSAVSCDCVLISCGNQYYYYISAISFPFL